MQFIDFGNRAVEGFDSLAALPGKARNVPILAHTVRLTGVPSAPLSEPKVEKQVETLRPLLEIPVKVKSIHGTPTPPEEKSDEWKSWSGVLEFEDKRTVNDMIAEKEGTICRMF